VLEKKQNNSIGNTSNIALTPKLKIALRKPKSRPASGPFNNPEITELDIEICSSPGSDSWLCRNCKTRCDKCYLMINNCKTLLKEKPKSKPEVQVDEEIQRRLKASEWTCPYCKQTTDRFYNKFHYRCIPEDVKAKLDKLECKAETEICPDCNEVINSYYKNFHYPKCKAHEVHYSSQSKSNAQIEYLQDPLEEFRHTPAFKRAQLFLYDLRKKEEGRRELISAQFRLRSGDKTFRSRTIPRHSSECPIKYTMNQFLYFNTNYEY
jgi:hypothetical protein